MENTKTIIVKVTPEQKEKLVEMARADERDLSKQIRFVIDEAWRARQFRMSIAENAKEEVNQPSA